MLSARWRHARTDQDDLRLAAISLSGLVAPALSLGPGLTGDNLHARRSYLEWLYQRVLATKFDADPRLKTATVEVLSRPIFNARADLASKLPEELLDRFFQQLYWDLPGPIRDELDRDIDFMRSVGFRPMLLPATCTLTPISTGKLLRGRQWSASYNYGADLKQPVTLRLRVIVSSRGPIRSSIPCQGIGSLSRALNSIY